jgi:hypothetical protein
MHQRAILMCRPKALPRRVARDSSLNLHAGAASNGDLDDHAWRRLASANDSERYFMSLRISRDGLQ